VVTVRVQDSAGGLDQHSCSLVIVPEPAAIAMIAFALVLFVRRAPHRRTNRSIT
jgi:hypothetical protein